MEGCRLPDDMLRPGDSIPGSIFRPLGCRLPFYDDPSKNKLNRGEAGLESAGTQFLAAQSR